MEISLNFKETNWSGSIKKAIEIGLTKVSMLMRNEAMDKCPKGVDNALYNDIKREVKENEARVFTTLEYAHAVEFGSRPHFPPVKALKRWAQVKLGDENLAFAVAKSISKKGTKEHKFMRPALYNNEKKITDIINNEIKKANAK